MPFWRSRISSGNRPAARSTLGSDRDQTAPTYREPFKKRRCLVPATSWYEWQGIDAKAMKPHHFQPLAKPFAFAGVWDVWKGDGQEPTTSFSIVTTSPAPSTAQYHDRMPVVLEKSQFEDWMRGPPELAAEMMEPYGGEMRARAL